MYLCFGCLLSYRVLQHGCQHCQNIAEILNDFRFNKNLQNKTIVHKPTNLINLIALSKFPDMMLLGELQISFVPKIHLMTSYPKTLTLKKLIKMEFFIMKIHYISSSNDPNIRHTKNHIWG